MRITGVHGIRVSDGGQGTLAPVLDKLAAGHGHETDLYSYGRVTTLGARFAIGQAAERLAEHQPVVTLAHSHGNNVVYEYLRQGGRLQAHIAYQPAMRPDTVWPHTVRRILVLTNPRDWALALGTVFSAANPVSWFRPHPFGRAGRRGYRGHDDRMTTIDASHYVSRWRHSYMHTDPAYWAKLIADWLRAGD